MVNKKVCILTSRKIGEKCLEWAKNNTPEKYIITSNIIESDIIISILYDKILPLSSLNNRIGYNFHPGILPEYRGAGAFSWAIINEDQKSGITLHLINEGIDTGDIIEIEEFQILNTDTAFSLFSKGEKIIFKMFKKWYHNLLKMDYISTPQLENKARIYYRKDLDKVKDISKYIRAFYFPGKESAYYIDNLGKKQYVDFKNDGEYDI